VKSVFSGAWHGRRKDKVSIRRQLKRRYVLAFFQKLQACLVGIESRATSEARAYRGPQAEQQPQAVRERRATDRINLLESKFEQRRTPGVLSLFEVCTNLHIAEAFPERNLRMGEGLSSSEGTARKTKCVNRLS
jgi:hypothetical protein